MIENHMLARNGARAEGFSRERRPRAKGGWGLSFGKLSQDEAKGKLVDRHAGWPSHLAISHFFVVQNHRSPIFVFRPRS
jgi:hypothetical protein